MRSFFAALLASSANAQYCANVDDPYSFEVTGSAKLFGYLQTCPGATTNPTCDRCAVISQHTNSVSDGHGGGGTWGQIRDDEVDLPLTAGVQVTWPEIPMSDVQANLEHPPCKGENGVIEVGVSGWKLTQKFYCDCSLTSLESTAIFGGNKCGESNDQPCGVVQNMQGKCTTEMKFASRYACYEGYCENRHDSKDGAGNEGDAGGSGISGGSKFAIVACVGMSMFVATAFFVGTRRKNQTTEDGSAVTVGIAVIYENICGALSGGSSTIPGEDNRLGGSVAYQTYQGGGTEMESKKRSSSGVREDYFASSQMTVV